MSTASRSRWSRATTSPSPDRSPASWAWEPTFTPPTSSSKTPRRTMSSCPKWRPRWKPPRVSPRCFPSTSSTSSSALQSKGPHRGHDRRRRERRAGAQAGRCRHRRQRRNRRRPRRGGTGAHRARARGNRPGGRDGAEDLRAHEQLRDLPHHRDHSHHVLRGRGDGRLQVLSHHHGDDHSAGAAQRPADSDHRLRQHVARPQAGSLGHAPRADHRDRAGPDRRGRRRSAFWSSPRNGSSSPMRRSNPSSISSWPWPGT